MAVSSPADASTAERLRLVRPLGARGTRTWAAIESLGDGKTRLVVVEKVPRGGEQGDGEIADWIRDARRLATLEHPNLARVRDVSVRGDEVLVKSDYLDGARWSELGAASARPALETALRVLVDVLSGLGAMHNLRDANREPVKLVHANLTPEHVIVGLDGMARLVLPCRVRGGGLQEERAGSAYLAPEILLGDESADARADIYGVGAILWEALSGRALFAGVAPSAIVTQLLSGRVPKATVPEASPWAAPLVEVAARAMSADPEKRFSSAAAMAAEIRRVAGAKLPPAMRVAGYVRGVHGDRIRARRQEIERGEVPVALEAEPRPWGEIDVDVDTDARSTAVPGEPPPTNTSTTRPPPPIEAAPPVVVPVAPALPAAPPLAAAAAAPPAPRAPPPLRPKPPTMSGVAPPPPPAPVPELVPEPEPVVASPAPSPVPAMPPMVTPLDEPLPVVPVQRRKVPVALIAVPVALAAVAAAAVVGWSASRAPEPADATRRPPAPSVTAAAATPPAPTPSQEPETPPATASTTVTTAVPTTEAPAAPTAAPLPVAAPVAPARPPPRPRYEPEGI